MSSVEKLGDAGFRLPSIGTRLTNEVYVQGSYGE
jgi:hypothetical protein